MVLSQEWDRVGVGQRTHTHRQKHAVEAETGWLGNTKETVEKNTSLLNSQKKHCPHRLFSLFLIVWP